MHTLLEIKRHFSVSGSILVILSLMGPFFAAWAVSRYENRLLAYFSEGRENLTKGNIIGSVLSSTAFPVFGLSFVLLGLSALFGQPLDLSPDASGTFAVPSLMQALVYVPATLLFAVTSVGLLRRQMYRDKLADNPELRRSFLRWVFGLNALAQLVIILSFWVVLYLFPEQANTQIN